MQLNITYRKVEDLIPYVNNSRKHSDQQVAQIAASIKEFGWTNPILVDKDKGIIAGHGRLMAARKLKMDDVPTIELSHLSEAQKKALICSICSCGCSLALLVYGLTFLMFMCWMCIKKGSK